MIVALNASTLTTKGNSFNCTPYNGDVIQDDLYLIMVIFRKYIFAFTADMKNCIGEILSFQIKERFYET